MSEPVPTVLSVRGEARAEVAPDLATLGCTVRADERDRLTATRTVSALLDALLADLRGLGGVPRSAGERRPLTWSAYAVSSYVETRWDDAAGRQVPTGRVLAAVDVRIEVRDFAVLAGLESVLARHEAVDRAGVGWSVDEDNPAWPRVRGAAIDAALQRARDYAAALGGSLVAVTHVADVGLLGGADGPHRPEFAAMSAHRLAADAGGADGASLDPVPQLVQATIEARCTASVRPLA